MNLPTLEKIMWAPMVGVLTRGIYTTWVWAEIKGAIKFSQEMTPFTKTSESHSTH